MFIAKEEYDALVATSKEAGKATSAKQKAEVTELKNVIKAKDKEIEKMSREAFEVTTETQLKEAKLELNYEKENKAKDNKIAELESKNEMLERAVKTASEIVSVKETMNKLIEKLPELKINTLSVPATTTKE